MRRSSAAAGLLVLVAAGAAGAADWREKVDPWVLETARAGTTEILVVLADQADLQAAARLAEKRAKGRFVVETLRRTAAQTQPPLLKALADRGVEHRPYWIVNMVWVRGDLELVQALAARPDVAHVSANPRVALDELPPPGPDAERAPASVEWGVAKVRAPDVWALGITGDGVVVAGQDTGYRWDHPALVNQYRGGPDGDHAYNWHDAVHSGGGACGADSPVPCDDHGHGTHTMGTIVGDDGGTNQIGVAPGARWIGCRNMDQGVGTPATYAECYQFFLAPTDLAGENPDPDLAPDVINNSWGCPVSEGCTDPAVLLGVVQAVRAAGIVTVHSAGNEGSSCGSVETPAAIYDESFSVGATNSSDAIASFSSRGPVTVDSSNRPKPDVTAPGVDIRSASSSGGYTTFQGTSMAGPHVAGVVALLLSAAPGIAGDVDLVEQIVATTSVPLTTSQGCGGDGPADVPNNVYGWGRVDAAAAVAFPLDFTLDLDPATLAICAPADGSVEVAVGQHQGFSELVVLSVDGLPSGMTSGFDPSPVTPPGGSTLTLAGTGSATAGTYPLEVVGVATPSGIEHRAPLLLALADGVPGLPSPTSPAPGATGVATLPQLTWGAAAEAVSYRLQLAGDEAFTAPTLDVEVASTSHQVAAPLTSSTTYWWRVRAGNGCGDGAWSTPASFTVRDVPPLLLVDDDDNTPDVRGTYTAALDAAGTAYDVWDTANSDAEPGSADLAPYAMVVWFTGDEFGGAAGPGAAGEAALAAWLDGGGCALLSSQEYYYDRGLTAFMGEWMGVAAATSDVHQSTVTGAGPVFGGLGPYALAYPFTDYADRLTATAGTDVAFTGNNGTAGLSRAWGGALTTFWGFPFEALPAAGRGEVLQRFLDACAALPLFADGFERGSCERWSGTTP